MGTSSDFYKSLALDCTAQQIAIDIFAFSSRSRFIDLATLCRIPVIYVTLYHLPSNCI